MNNFEKEQDITNPSDMTDTPSDLPDEVIDSPDETIDLPDINNISSESHTIMEDLNQNVEEIDDIMEDILNQHDTKIIEQDYSKMTVSELKKILTDKNLTVSGNKTKLIERIKENP
tara:strand:- start:408 stop:755 length:348 start_codon:yes stop_codon:yes gene_type:complete